MLFESHVNELALNKFADDYRSLTAEGMGKTSVHAMHFTMCNGAGASSASLILTFGGALQ